MSRASRARSGDEKERPPDRAPFFILPIPHFGACSQAWYIHSKGAFFGDIIRVFCKKEDI